jgi:outer membrane protein TolC
VGQPIFHSGRLLYSWKQANWQKKEAAQNVSRIYSDVIFELKKSYYNLIKAQHNMRYRKDLMKQAERLYEIARKKKELDIITETDALAVESQYTQIRYRLLSDEKDLQISRLRLESVLNTAERLPEILPDPLEPFDPKQLVEIRAPVEKLINEAYKQRPEFKTAEAQARINYYGEKIARADKGLHIDASGFRGKSGAAFTDSESITLKDSWNVGVQASLYFAGNVIRGTGTGEKTSPDLGETSRTRTNARTLNVGFLDGIGAYASAKQARIARERAEVELDQTRRNIEMEVREAVFNVEKAKLQVLGSNVELNYRQKEVSSTVAFQIEFL